MAGINHNLFALSSGANISAPERDNRGEPEHCNCNALLREAALINCLLDALELALYHC